MVAVRRASFRQVGQSSAAAEERNSNPLNRLQQTKAVRRVTGKGIHQLLNELFYVGQPTINHL
ncbi:MAG TPA: hypothetical protein DCY03_09615 [Planctomycetaceae bacterium]|nr:hypothetical protein [Planctomycetaceae bacterium]